MAFQILLSLGTTMLNVVEPSVKIITSLLDLALMPTKLEVNGRTCYNSEDRITQDSSEKFVRMICRNHHESVLEHCSITVRINCSRACSHQLVRHRLASYSQRSMRYVVAKEPRVICPPVLGMAGEYVMSKYEEWVHPDGTLVEDKDRITFLDSVLVAYESYENLLKSMKPEDARFVLPLCTETEIVVTMNLRAWRHVFRERALNKHAQWEIRGIMLNLLKDFQRYLPCVFGDLT